MTDSKKKRKVIITPRDETLFKYLFVNKVAAVSDIAKDVFDNASLKTVHRRLMKLSRENFIEAQGQRERGNRMLYSLTKKSFKRFISEEKVMRRVQLKSDSVSHDLTLLKLKRRFKDLKNVQGFYSENLILSGVLDNVPEIKHLRELRPDAIIKVNVNNKTLFLPLEYEASSKYSRRNEKLLSKYYLSPHVPAVIFLSKSEAIEKRICHKEMERKSTLTGKFYYGLLENVLTDKNQLTLTNIKKEVLLIS